ncbi:MAG: hypothetical protein AAF354_13450 [Pseudomonadota bacterium]
MTMKTILTLAACLAAATTLALFPFETATAQDGATGDDVWESFMQDVERDKADRERCSNLSNAVSPQEQYDACTRLIEGAPNENDLVGTYYVNRATVHGNPTAQCKDVTKGVEIIERENPRIFGGGFLESAKRLQNAACN